MHRNKKDSASIWPCVSTRTSKRVGVLAATVFVAAASACLFLDWRLRILAADDSYIHLRIAEHLLQSGHAFFNINERVMVTSSPVWTLLLALSILGCHRLPPALPLEALSLGVACTISFLLAVAFSACENRNQIARGIYVMLVPCVTFLLLLQSSVFQMETPLAVALLLFGTYLWYRESSWWLCVLVIAGFVRYEYFAIGAILFCFAVLNRRVSVRSTLQASFTLAAGLLWLQYQFGTLIPNTLSAKVIAYVITPSETFLSLGYGVKRCSLLLAVFIVISFSRSRRQINAPNVLFLGGLFLSALYIAHRTFIFPWYLPLPFAPIVLGLLLGAATVSKNQSSLFIVMATLLLLPVKPVAREVLAAVRGEAWKDPGADFNIRTREYLLVGRAIFKVCPEVRLLTSEIGGLGEGFPGEILDGLGLATPAATKYHPMRIPEDRKSGGVGAIPPEFVTEAKPDVIVSYDRFSEALRRDYDRSRYQVLTYPGLPLREGPHYSMWTSNLYVFVNRQGACTAQDVDREIYKQISTE